MHKSVYSFNSKINIFITKVSCLGVFVSFSENFLQGTSNEGKKLEH